MKSLIVEDVYNTGRIKSEHLYAELISGLGWEGFPNYAEEFIKVFSVNVAIRNDSVDTRVWEVIKSGQSLRLLYEDYPVMISLESHREGGGRVIEELK